MAIMHKDYRHKKYFMRVNTLAAILLAGTLTVMLNYLSARHWRRADVSRTQYSALSPATLDLLKNIPMRLTITALAEPNHELFRDVQQLLRSYAGANAKIRIEFVDPHRDLAHSKELALRHDINEPNYLLLEFSDRIAAISLKDLAEYDYSPMLAGRSKAITAFRGEQAVSATIHGLLQPNKPVIGFLAGHGEKSIENHDQTDGFLMIARLISRNNYEVKTILLGSDTPPEYDVLVVAGPTRPLPQPEINMIKKYLEHAGRVLVMLDPGVDAGLNDLLMDWGIRVGDDRVSGITLTGRELLLNHYGNHPITARMKNLTTIFNIPRSIQPLAEPDAPSDRPRATVLAATSEKGWADKSAYQNPMKFDPDSDQAGPIAVAVAVEKGPTDAANVELKPARLIVFGDSTMVNNGALSAGYSSDLFLNSINWLAETGTGPRIAPRVPPVLTVTLSNTQLNFLYAALCAAFPAIAAIAGLIVIWRRRK